MTKVKNTVAYKIKSPLSLQDFAVGTNNEDGVPGIAKGQTISIGLDQMRELFLAGLSPETGGTLKITEIVPETEETSISEVVNALSPAYEVQRYELFFVDLNGVIYLLKSQNLTIGTGQTALDDDDFIKFTSIVSKGTGQAMVSYNYALKQYEVLTIDSDTLTKTVGENGLRLEIPSTSTIPSLYVNNLYVPTEEEFVSGNTKGYGTLAKPFTDTITAYVSGSPVITPDTAIQNALNAYVGTGTALAPQLSGQKIIVQNNNSSYTFSGNLNYSDIDIEIQGNVSSTTSGFLLDMDDSSKFNANTSKSTIRILPGAILQIQGSGLNNTGNNVATNTFATGRIVNLLNTGAIYSTTNDVSKYILNADVSNTGNNNDGNLCFNVESTLNAVYQGVYKVGGGGKVDFYGSLLSGLNTITVDVNLKAFHQTGGQVRMFEGSSKSFSGPRTSAITFTPTGGFTPAYIGQNSSLRGDATNLFHKTNSSNVSFQFTNSDSYYLLNVTNVFESSNLWSLRFTENVLGSGTIDPAKADLTQGNNSSSINTIGNNLVETLVVYASRALAVAGGLTKGAKFLNRKTVTAGAFVVGTEYVIATVGSTDYTLIGASSNTVGINFTASGVGSGTGTAYRYAIDVII